MKKTSFIPLLFCLISISLYAQEMKQKKSISALKIAEKVKIDAQLDEPFWIKAIPAKDFIQLRPYNGEPASQTSEVKFVYDNNAIYIGASLLDTSPDSILTELSKRDEIRNSDYFGVYLDPFNDGVNAFGFFVTSAGVQVDMKSTKDGEDNSWDAVWQSKVKITENGWTVEMRIPYSAIRFPKTETQLWRMNMFRNIMRHRENTSWNFINLEVNGINNQAGMLTDIKNIVPPVRLSFTPYLSTYFEKNSDASSWGYSLKGGMDLKYGINESYTLDMMLIPDFGQVQSDDEQLNLSPFEIYYDEKRAFFTEGTELFTKGGIFYSRRIGGEPERYGNVEDELAENEIIDKNPNEVQLLNATKISGKNTQGLGIGFLNAMTATTYAKIKDTITGENQEICTQPFTNFNMFVLDQSLKNNSFISIANTNYVRPKDDYTSNVTAMEGKIADNKQTYFISGNAVISQIYDRSGDAEEEMRFGYKYRVEGGKQNGQFRYSIWQNVESDKYEPNDMGFLMQNNEFSNGITIRYYRFKPFWKVLNWYNTMQIWHSMLYHPRKYMEFMLSFNSNTTFKNHYSLGFNTHFDLKDENNYFEARVDDRVFIEPKIFNAEIWGSSDYRKSFAFDQWVGFFRSARYDMHGYWYGFSPRWRVNDKLSFTLEHRGSAQFNRRGYVEDVSTDSVYFGRRNNKTIINTLEADYIFNNRSSLGFRLRHYWSQVEYDEFFLLNENGTLRNASYNENADINYNAFNVDMVYTWNFAPGSELLIVWKNSIYTDSEIIINNYFDNLRDTWESSQTNSFSIKFLYYLDYQYLKRKKK